MWWGGGGVVGVGGGVVVCFFFFFNDTATTEIYTLSLHDALPIYSSVAGALSAVSFVFILTVAIAIYSATSPSGPEGTLTTPNPPESYATREGWSNFASGFFIGGCGGAVFAFLLTQSPHLLPLQAIFGGM